MQKRNSLQLFRSKDLLFESKRISSIVAQSRMSLSPVKKSRKECQNEEAEPVLDIVFPIKRRRNSLNIDDNLKSDEYVNSLRNRENLSKKLQRMRDSIRLPSDSDSPIKLLKMPISFRKPNEVSENVHIPLVNAEFDKQVNDTLHGIRKNMLIFQALFQSSRNRYELLHKLYGWDDDFQQLFFDNNQIQNFTVEQVKIALGLDKKTPKSKNYFNKLKLFLGELIRVNEERESLLAEIQKQKINEEIREIQNIEKNFYNSCKGLDKHIYDSMVKQTRGKVVGMKSRIKDKNNLLKVIEEQTGGMPRIDNFFRKQEENIASLQTLLVKKTDESTEL